MKTVWEWSKKRPLTAIILAVLLISTLIVVVVPLLKFIFVFLGTLIIALIIIVTSVFFLFGLFRHILGIKSRSRIYHIHEMIQSERMISRMPKSKNQRRK